MTPCSNCKAGENFLGRENKAVEFDARRPDHTGGQIAHMVVIAHCKSQTQRCGHGPLNNPSRKCAGAEPAATTGAPVSRATMAASAQVILAFRNSTDLFLRHHRGCRCADSQAILAAPGPTGREKQYANLSPEGQQLATNNLAGEAFSGRRSEGNF